MIIKDNSGIQKRPTSIVNSILEAAALLLPRAGYRESTTNRIAEKAGVSIGSLYYYFRGKDAVYRELADKIMSSYLQRIEERLRNMKTVSEINGALISEVVDFTFENRELLKTLFSMSSKLGRLETVFNLRNDFAQNLAIRMRANSGGNENSMPTERVFILVNAINGVLDNYIYSTNCPLNKKEMKDALIRLANSSE